ncbi:MAG: phosphatidylinositol-specific phospholipase C domain-containing protein [Chloroflexi bacterium]|nr:phosphatidylinositol-specific phospholipase C domain-containing protein [Chloroflexota bacterium]
MSAMRDALRLARAAPRPVASWLLLAAGAVLLLAAEWVLWADEVLFDADGFSERAVRALDDDDVQEYVSTVIVDTLIEEGSPDLIAARPLIEAAVQAVIGSAAFEQLYETALRETHRTILSDDPIVLQIVDASVVVKPTLANFNPELAESIPDLDTEVLEIAESEALHAVLDIAEGVRILALVLPLLAVGAFVASWAVARGRRRAAMRVGIALVVVAVLMVLLLDFSKAVLEALVGGERAGAAAAGVWDAFLGDLRSWNLAIGAGGALMATAASPWFAGLSPAQAPARVWELMTAPGSNAGRLMRALIAVAAGWFALVSPGDFIELCVGLLGLGAVYLGAAELIRLLWVERAETAEELARAAAAQRPRLSPVVRLATVAALIAVGVAIVAVLVSGLRLIGGGDPGARAAPTACNGHAELCERPLNEVALAATHNSMSAASEGWFFAAHGDGIADQLDHGIRGLLIDVWFGSPARNGVSTELLGGSREVMVERYGLEAVESRERIAARLGPTSGRELYLCHGFCELGATPLRDALDDIRRFLVTNPAEVVIVFIQDEAPAADIAAAFVEAGLERYAYAHPGRAAPWPTLGELVDRNERLIVMTENADRAPAPWLHRGFELTQETPFAFRSVGDLSCEPNRGAPDAPLFLVNHWIEDVAPSPEDAELLNASAVLLPRLRECATDRGLTPNLVAVNFSRSGDLLAVIDELNGVGGTAAE